MVYDNSGDIGVQNLYRAQGLQINKGGCCWTTDQSSWAVMEVIVWNRTLQKAELSLVGAYLQWQLESGTNPRSSGATGKDPYPVIPDPIPQENLEAWFRNSDIQVLNGQLFGWESYDGRYQVTWSNSIDSAFGDPALTVTADQGPAHGSGPFLYLAPGDKDNKKPQFLRNIVYGTAQHMLDFGTVLKQTYTICSVTRYTSAANQGTIFVSSNGDIHGHWNRRVGVANYGEVWRTRQWDRNIGSLEWLIFCGSNAGGPVLDGTSDVSINDVDATVPNFMNPGMLPANSSDYQGLSDVDYSFYVTNQQNLQINSAGALGFSDFALFELAVWNRQLSLEEMQTVVRRFQFMLRTGYTSFR